jgi:8-oxo-dGTP diphosphatase
MDAKGYQAKTRVKMVVAVYLMLLDTKDGILITRRCNTGYEDGKYNFPSGHIEEGESPLEALIRETEEEVGKRIADELRENPPELCHTSWRPKHDETGDRIDLYFHHETGRVKEKIVNGEPDKCDDFRFVHTDEPLPENFVPHNRVAFEVAFQGKSDHRGVSQTSYSELGLDWLKAVGAYKL